MIKHKGEKPSFTGGHRLVSKEQWLAYGEQFDLPKSYILEQAQRSGKTIEVVMAEMADEQSKDAVAAVHYEQAVDVGTAAVVPSLEDEEDVAEKLKALKDAATDHDPMVPGQRH